MRRIGYFIYYESNIKSLDNESQKRGAARSGGCPEKLTSHFHPLLRLGKLLKLKLHLSNSGEELDSRINASSFCKDVFEHFELGE
ncbi:hypothetical protein H5410_054213 [Solanum commersonii]|uniref:Uncharacterized protein n=1 Tax=Solanum commersonii TaxID=4109 RepID=A0A9J5X6U3_SOLCO|nr:hypothetical protein H5410_054213 [Solanum commersonii]